MDKRNAEDQDQGAEYAPTDQEAEQAGREGAEQTQEDLDEAGVPADADRS